MFLLYLGEQLHDARTIGRMDSLSRGIAGQSPAAQDFVLYEYIGLSMPAVKHPWGSTSTMD